MTVDAVLAIAIAVLALMLVAGAPVAFGLAASGTAGILLLDTADIAGATLASVPYQATSVFTLTVVPMFILMGVLAARAGLGADLLALGNKALGRLPGGLGVATVASCAGFAAVTGSSVATVATIGRLSISEMVKYGYQRSFAAGIVGSAATLGILIPPSIILVLYGVLTGESVGLLLLAGIVPGLISAAVLSAFIIGRVVANPGLIRPSRSAAEPHGAGPDFAELRGAISDLTASRHSNRDMYVGLFRVAVLAVVVLGGIYTGVFTPTESAAVGALLALLMMLVDRKRSQDGLLADLASALRESASTTAMIFAILVGAGIFTFFLVSAEVPTAFTEAVLDLELSSHLTVALLLATLIPLGMFLDGFSMLLIFVPLAYPVVSSLGFDGIWFGILVVKLIELGLITPPLGINAYTLAAVDTDLTVEETFRGLAIFVVADLCVIALLFLVPELTTVIPDLADKNQQ